VPESTNKNEFWIIKMFCEACIYGRYKMHYDCEKTLQTSHFPHISAILECKYSPMDKGVYSWALSARQIAWPSIFLLSAVVHLSTYHTACAADRTTSIYGMTGAYSAFFAAAVGEQTSI
jgi:hypothetical protein